MDRAYILAEIKRTALENGDRPLGWRRFAAATGIRQGDWERYWPRFGDATKEAGFSPNRLQPAFAEPYLLAKLADLTRDLGHIPSYAELRHKSHTDKSFPNAKVFSRIGAKPLLVAKLARFCDQSEGYQDVVAICGPVSVVDTEVPAAPEPLTGAVLGAVYLLKSGRYYKIGRTNAVGRRERELAIQLPEPVKVVHEIRSDDPSGIEAYWHRRFQDRRRNGEWFELLPADVSAFRRRKFM